MENEFLFWETDSGEDGLRLYNTEQPDCVLLDYNLPDLNGLEFLARLDSERSDDAAPIIMLTGQGTERVAVQALKMGAQDYLDQEPCRRVGEVRGSLGDRESSIVPPDQGAASRTGADRAGAARKRRTIPPVGRANATRERGAIPAADRRRDWVTRSSCSTRDGHVVLVERGGRERCMAIVPRRLSASTSPVSILPDRRRRRPSPGASSSIAASEGHFCGRPLESPQGRITIPGPRQRHTTCETSSVTCDGFAKITHSITEPTTTASEKDQ